MTDTLDLIHEAFVEYRRKHAKGAYPLVLRHRAVSALRPEERLQLAARLGLTAKQIGRWEKAAVSPPTVDEEFFEVPQVTNAQLPPSDLRIEVELPGGAMIRMHGQVDVDVLRTLVVAVQSAACAP